LNILGGLVVKYSWVYVLCDPRRTLIVAFLGIILLKNVTGFMLQVYLGYHCTGLNRKIWNLLPKFW